MARKARESKEEESSKMNLYLITQNENITYDTYDSAVVAAADEETARHTMIDDSPNTWALPQYVQVKLIGKALDGMEAGVVLASFNAG